MDPHVGQLLFLCVGLLLGSAGMWLIVQGRVIAAAARGRAASDIELARLNERLTAATEVAHELRQRGLEAERQAADERGQLESVRNERAHLAERVARMPLLQEQLADVTSKLETAQQESIRSAAQIASLANALDTDRKHAAEKLALLGEAREQLTQQFKVLANDILDANSKRFAEQNQTSLGQLLDPLKNKLIEFQGKVEEVYVKEGLERAALGQQVKHLMDLNQQLSQDAHNLTTALKGSNKTQGNWGELILEKILESSGLRRDHEYAIQESHVREDGSRAQPDVVVHLPADKHLVIDAKMSLVAYEEHAVADNDVQRQSALRRHIDSVRGHIRGLSEKSYQTLYDLKSLDFVVMFVPIEPAFLLAISHDHDLWLSAWQKNVLLVSPSTLLFVLRTIEHLWRQEQQNRNSQEIARRGAELYDKLVGFVEDFQGVGTRLQQAQKAFDTAFGKFSEGKGNVIRQAELLRKLGIKPSKNLTSDLIDSAMEDPLVLLMSNGTTPDL